MPLLTEVYQSENSRMNFMKGCVRLAKCDGVISAEEQQFFINAGTNLDLDNKNIQKLTSLMNNSEKKIPVNFENKRQSLFFFREGIQLCHVDGKYDDPEKKEIAAIAKELGIKSSEIKKLEKWVIDGMEWVKIGDKLLSDLEEK